MSMLATKKLKAKKKSAFGCLSEYADVSKIPLEKGAWEKEVAKKEMNQNLRRNYEYHF